MRAGRKPGMTVNEHCVSALAVAGPPGPDTGPRRVDHAAVLRAARDLLRAVGADVDAEALEETPRRVADAYAELLTPQPFRATTFPNDDGYDELIVAGDPVPLALHAPPAPVPRRGAYRL